MRERKGEVVAERVLSVRRQFRLVHQTAPRDIADIGRLNVGSEPGADGREDAVGADQQIAFFGRAVAEMGRDRRFSFLDAVEVPALMVAGVRQSGAEQAVEVTPGGQDLPERQFADDRAVPAEDAPARNRDADLRRLAVDAGALQHVEQFRVGHDAGAPAGQLGADPLEDVGLPAGAAEQECREKAGHGAADDDGSRLAWPGRDWGVLKRVVDMVRPPFGSAADGRRADRSCAFRRGKNGVRFDAAKNNPRSPAQCLSFDKQTMRPANGSCQ